MEQLHSKQDRIFRDALQVWVITIVALLLAAFGILEMIKYSLLE